MQVNIIDLIKPNSKNLKYHKISNKQMIIKAAKLESACVKSSAEIAAKSGQKRDLLTKKTIKNKAECCPILSGKEN